MQTRTSTHKLFLLLLASAICIGVLLLTRHLTKNRIERNERAWLEAQIDALLPKSLHDNNLLDDHTVIPAPSDLSPTGQLSVYRARLKKEATGVVIHSITNEGYNGPIELLIAVDYNGTIQGVRILNHHETPGMGDAFNQPGSTWLDNFKQRSLTNPDTRGWNVRKDGGEFEQFTSATITPRAIIHAIQRTLDFYSRNKDLIYSSEIKPLQ